MLAFCCVVELGLFVREGEALPQSERNSCTPRLEDRGEKEDLSEKVQICLSRKRKLNLKRIADLPSSIGIVLKVKSLRGNGLLGQLICNVR